MKKQLLLLLALFSFAYNVQAQCGPGQDTTPPVFGDAGDGSMSNPFRNLLQSTVGAVPSGTYYFNFNGNTFQGVLDNDTDGGGWLMILNYVHVAGDNPAVTVRNTDLPLLGSSTLGDNEAGTANWGHMGNALAAAIDFDEVRFYGVTTGHSRIIDFKTNYQRVLDYLKTGTGSFSGINNPSNFTALTSHTANIPAQASSVFNDQGDFALTNFPFWRSGSFHWGIGLANRWEVDDFSLNGSSTIHRVWVRGDLSPAGTTTLTVTLDATGNATVAPGDFGLTATDNCGTATLSLTQTDFDCTHIGNNTIQLTATDAQNNTTTIDVTVVIAESAPVITTDNGVNIDLDATGNVSITLADLNASATDDCGLQSFTLSQTDFDCSQANRPNTVTLTATDTNGNESTRNVVVFVNDPIAPVIECVAPFTLELDATGNAILTEDNILASATDNCAIDRIRFDKSTFTCADLGDNIVTMTVMDRNRNRVSCTTTVTITLPSCPSDFTLESDADACGAVYNYPCASNVTAGPASGTLLPVGSTTTFTYDSLDSEGNTVQCSYDVTVVDTRAPLFNTKDHTVFLNNNEAQTITVNDVLGEDPLARNYTVETSGMFDPVDISTTGTEVTLEDDEVSSALSIGFNFRFYGNLYTEFYISSNGFITFSDNQDDGCCSGQTLPDTSEPNNLIAYDWTDINPEEGGTIRYTTIGTAPNRVAIIDFEGVHYYDTTPDATTTQIKLFEGTNRIEIHGTSTFDAGNDKTQGIENSDGTLAVAVPGRNESVWATTNDYVAFIPTNGGVYDNCGIDTMEVSPDTFDIRNTGDTEVTVTLTDVNGNVSQKTAIVSVTADCFIDALPDNNFQIQVANETCTNKNNGILSIAAVENYRYVATLNGENYPFTSDLAIPDLGPGTYPICIAIDGIADCEKCYEFVIEEAPVLKGKTTINSMDNTIAVDIKSGTAPYTVMIDNEIVGEYNTNQFVVNTKNGGMVEVFSSKAACQGKLSTLLDQSAGINAYPNPTKTDATVYIPNANSNTVYLQINNALGTTVSEGVYDIQTNTVTLSMQHLPAGIYFVVVNKNTSKTLRIIKQ